MFEKETRAEATAQHSSRWRYALALLATSCAVFATQAEETHKRTSSGDGSSALVKASERPLSEAELRTYIANEVERAWKSSDFKWLDSTADEYIRTRAKTYSGKWRLSLFYGDLSDQLTIDWPTDWYMRTDSQNPAHCVCKRPDPAHYEEAELRWDQLRLKMDQWIGRRPPSAHARVALAQLLINRAWFYRGTGYDSSVAPQARPLVSRYLEESRKVLSDARAVRKTDPEWFEVMFFIASAQSWPQVQIDELIRDFRSSGHSYMSAYQSAGRLMLPKWGGSYEKLESFAQQATADDTEDGIEAYTRIYWNVVEAKIFPQSRASWETMKRGFQSILSKYPDARNLNGLAMYACGAGDADTFRDTLRRLAGKVTPDSWSIDLKYCTARYGNSLP